MVFISLFNFSEIKVNRELQTTLDAMSEIGLSDDFQQNIVMV